MNIAYQNNVVIKLYNNSLELIVPIGEKLDALIVNNPHEDYIVISYDLLKRIKGNLEILRAIPVNENSVVAVRLITRSIFADLIEGIFLLTKESYDELTKVLNIIDYQYVKSIKDFLKGRNELYNFDRASKGEKKINENEYLAEFNEKYKEFGKTGNITISCMAQEIEKLNHIELSVLKYLYTEYRVLSQSEHYCRENRKFSYCFENDMFILQHAKVINHTIKIFIQIILVWIEHKEFKMSYFEENWSNLQKNP